MHDFQTEFHILIIPTTGQISTSFQAIQKEARSRKEVFVELTHTVFHSIVKPYPLKDSASGKLFICLIVLLIKLTCCDMLHQVFLNVT